MPAAECVCSKPLHGRLEAACPWLGGRAGLAAELGTACRQPAGGVSPRLAAASSSSGIQQRLHLAAGHAAHTSAACPHRTTHTHTHTHYHRLDAASQVRDWYVESFRELRGFPKVKDAGDELQFTRLLQHIYRRHTNVVPVMAMGVAGAPPRLPLLPALLRGLPAAAAAGSGAAAGFAAPPAAAARLGCWPCRRASRQALGSSGAFCCPCALPCRAEAGAEPGHRAG